MQSIAWQLARPPNPSSCPAVPFDIAELREITMYDELELDTLGDKIFLHPEDKNDKSYQKTALFLIMSDTDSTFNFLISMIYTCAHKPGRVKQ